MDNPRDPRESCSRAYELPIQGVHCHKNQHFHGEDKHKPVAIASLRRVWRVFLDVIPRRVRPFGAEGGPHKDRMGFGLVGARSKCDSELKACLLRAVSEAKGQNRTQRGTGSSRPFGASLVLARNEIYGTTLPTHLLGPE